jgi:hypothetical protein
LLGGEIHTVVDLAVPALELVHADAVSVGDVVALVAGGDLVETVTVLGKSGHLWGVGCSFGGRAWCLCGGRRCLLGGARRLLGGRCLECGCSRVLGDGANHTIEIVGIQVGALDSGVQVLEVVDRHTPAARKALACSTVVSSRGEVTRNSTAGVGCFGRDQGCGQPSGEKVCQLHLCGLIVKLWEEIVVKTERREGWYSVKKRIHQCILILVFKLLSLRSYLDILASTSLDSL